MERHDPGEFIETVEQEWADLEQHYPAASEWFRERPGLIHRVDAVDELADHLDVDREVANLVVDHLVEDDVDPVQQLVRPTDGKYVGVIDHAEHDWFYAFDRYDDVEGRRRRAVCGHCVHEGRAAADVAHFTRAPDEYDLDRARVALGLHYHLDHEGRTLPDVLAEKMRIDPEVFADRYDLPGPGALSLPDVTRRLDVDPDLQARLNRPNPAPRVPDVDV